jgi:hypothetical protein
MTHQLMSTNLRLQYHQKPIKNHWSGHRLRYVQRVPLKLLKMTHQLMSTNLPLQYHQKPKTNQEPLVRSAAATCSKDTIAPIIVDNVETPQTAPKKSRTPYRLSNEEAGAFVNEQVKLLLTFYTVDLNAKRNGPPLGQQTKDKLVERLYCFLFFCKRISNKLDLNLALCNDETLISEYVNYLSKVRELMPNTICAHLTTIR